MSGETKLKKTRNFATRITIIYIVLGSVWILFSDKLMFLLLSDIHSLTLVSTYKGWFYVLFTGVILFLLIKSELRKRNAIEDQLKAARDQAEESEMLKTAFLNNISHEIRTPMNAIIGFSELIADPAISTEQKRNFSTYIHRGVSNLLATIDDIIIISRIQVKQVKLEEKDGDVIVLMNELREYFQAQLKLQKKDKLVDFVLHGELEPEESIIITDFRNLRQIFNKLISNAAKFTDKGKIELWCKKSSQDELLFIVHDTGIGIPPEKKDVVFIAFRQGEETMHKKNIEGSGIGLSIAKGLVELMNGRIWFESEPGKGSTFYFTIPYVRSNAVTL
jgi:signal transduction histidine kinase